MLPAPPLKRLGRRKVVHQDVRDGRRANRVVRALTLVDEQLKRLGLDSPPLIHRADDVPNDRADHAVRLSLLTGRSEEYGSRPSPWPSAEPVRRIRTLVRDICLFRWTGARCQSLRGAAAPSPLQGERQIRGSSAEIGEGTSGQPTQGYARLSGDRPLRQSVTAPPAEVQPRGQSPGRSSRFPQPPGAPM